MTSPANDATGDSITTIGGMPVVVPLAGFYRRDESFEKRRMRFYWNMQRAESMPDEKQPKRKTTAGRSGQRQQIVMPDRLKSTTIINRYGSVVQYIEASDDIDDPVSKSATDREKNQARAWGDFRRRIARFIRDLDEAASRSPLASPDLMKEPTGNSARPAMLSAGRLEAMDLMGKLHRNVPRDSMAVIEAEVLRDEFGFLTHSSRRSKAIAIEDLRRALDWCVYVLSNGGEITFDRLRLRWPEVRLAMLRQATEQHRKLRQSERR